MPRNDSVVILVCCLVALLLSAGCTSSDRPLISPDISHTPATEELMQQIRSQYPAPGDLYEINGTRMHIHCEGEGSPMVIMEAGSGDCSLSWALVQQNVSKFTRVCTYDRAGYGWSDPVPGPVSARNVTSRLHALLSRANLSPPYVLVGHSLGGVYVRSYAQRYPGDVTGMILVDPGSEWQASRTGDNFTREMQAAITVKVSQLRKMGYESANGTFARNLSLVDMYSNPRLPLWEYHAYRALWATEPWFWNSCADEGSRAFQIWDEVSRENITRLNDIPLIVISSGGDMGFSADPIEDARANEVFRSLQKEMAMESLKGQYLIAKNSSHYIQIDEPDIVTNSIHSVIQDIRNNS